MGYEEAAAHLDALGVDAMKARGPSLHRIEAMCEALNHPERAIPAIHVAGTNGKTSTARIAASLLKSAGLSVGTYTSPHLQSVRERIASGGEPLSEAGFGDVFDHLRPYLEVVEKELDEELTYFEVLTAMYFLWAADAPVDVSVVEVGLGGRWDATNVVPARVAVVTNVGLDHTGLLGLDRETIAGEKAGIVKTGSEVVTGERSPSVLRVIADAADTAGTEMLLIDRDFHLDQNALAFGGRYLSVRTAGSRYEGLFLPLHGAHQGVNAAVALQAVDLFVPVGSLSQELVAAGLAATRVPGRIETVPGLPEGSPAVVMDVAHNPDGMSALISSLVEAFAFERAIFVVGILEDKDYRGMLAEIARVPASLVVTAPRSVRGVPPAALIEAASEVGLEAEAVESVEEATARALARAATADLVCITGSHYVVGEARSVLVAS